MGSVVALVGIKSLVCMHQLGSSWVAPARYQLGEYDWLRKTCTNLYTCMNISENDHGLIDLLMALYAL